MTDITIPPEAHEYVADPYRPARCVNCGERREHATHRIAHDITLPPEALEAAAKDLKLLLADLVDADTRVTELTDVEHIVLVNAACLAMLRNWPGSDHLVAGEIHDKPVIILPLPQEASDE